MDRFQCSLAAARRDEAALGSASRIDRWLLVEAAGPWGPRALPQTRALDDRLLLSLQQRARTDHARTLLVRRPARHCDADHGGRRLFLADSRPGRERLLTRLVRDRDLDDIALPYDGHSAGWLPLDRMVLVCTQGRHDPCCAVRGRPVAAALAAAFPEETWEVSHIGGDRFAANVLVLPAGHYLGQLPPERAAEAVGDLLDGRRPEPYYRGRSCWPMAVQAALSLAGASLGLDRLADLRPVSVARVDDHRWRVELGRPGGTVAVEVEQRLGPESSRLTCHAEAEHPVPSWHLLSLAADGSGSGVG